MTMYDTTLSAVFSAKKNMIIILAGRRPCNYNAPRVTRFKRQKPNDPAPEHIIELGILL